MSDFNKVGLLVIRDDKVLLCRKGHFTSRLIMPGGRVEGNETDQECLSREVSEELGVTLLPGGFAHVGTYRDVAASDDPSIRKTVEIRLYDGELADAPRPSSEIVELVWFGPEVSQDELSPIIRNKILPDLLRQGRLRWPNRSGSEDTSREARG